MERVELPVWDLPLRLFHWLLVLAILAAYVTSQLGGLWLQWHTDVGLLTFALIVFRIAWGFMGSTHSRYTSFVPTPRRLRAFVSARWVGPGHNPLGALSVFLLLALSGAQSTLGLFSIDEDLGIHGPLYDSVSAYWSDRLTVWHSQLFNALAALIGIHMIAIVFYASIKGQDLVLPMITGKARIKCGQPIRPIQGGGPIQFLISILIAATLAWLIESGLVLQCL